VGEALLYVSRLARLFGDDPSIVVRCRFMGLNNRILTSIENRRMIFDDRVCADEEATMSAQVWMK
jgi:hypothetical protein